MPLPEADRLQFPVTKSQCTFCLSPGTSALPKDGDGALCSSSANPPFNPYCHHLHADLSSRLLATLTGFGLRSPPIPTLGHCLQCSMAPGPGKFPSRKPGSEGPSPAQPLHWCPTVYLAKAELRSAALSAPSPPQPTLPGSSWPLPRKPAFWWKRGIGIPWTSLDRKSVV